MSSNVQIGGVHEVVCSRDRLREQGLVSNEHLVDRASVAQGRCVIRPQNDANAMHRTQVAWSSQNRQSDIIVYQATEGLLLDASDANDDAAFPGSNRCR
jgi:hypothetical protein